MLTVLVLEGLLTLVCQIQHESRRAQIMSYVFSRQHSIVHIPAKSIHIDPALVVRCVLCLLGAAIAIPVLLPFAL